MFLIVMAWFVMISGILLGAIEFLVMLTHDRAGRRVISFFTLVFYVFTVITAFNDIFY
jgi:hypothetical protein